MSADRSHQNIKVGYLAVVQYLCSTKVKLILVNYFTTFIIGYTC